MKKLILLQLLLITLILTFSSFAADMLVSGAGTVEVNGVYTNMGTHASLSDGVDYYQMGSFYLFRVTDGSDIIWILGIVLGDPGGGSAYYGELNSLATPNGMTLSMPGALGTEPGPSIVSTNGVPDMVVFGAGTAEVNGGYANMGTDASLSDGVNYYQMDSIYLFRYDDSGTKIWLLGAVLGNKAEENAYYGEEYSGNTPDGLTFGVAGALGILPGPTVNDVPLPVELVSFAARNISDGVKLTWTTESEVDNLGFTIERKSGGMEWREIASYRTYESLCSKGDCSSQRKYEFVDNNNLNAQTFTYRLSQTDINGQTTLLTETDVTVAKTPDITVLEPAYPNPFNPETRITYHLAMDSKVELSVYDILGRKVITLFNEQQSAGSYHVRWNGLDQSGYQLPSGIYILQLRSGNFAQTQKVQLVR